MLVAADLHTHTTASDGTLTPADLVRRAKEAGLTAVAVTDHDTMAGLSEALTAARRHGIVLVPGIEISTDAIGREVHILGYHCRPDDAHLTDLLARLRAGRRERLERMIANLRLAGIGITWADVCAQEENGSRATSPDTSLGRPHVARALVRAGYAGSVAEAFERFLLPGRPGYVPRFKLHPTEAVRAIRRAGGVPVLAHPDLIGDDTILPELLDAGLMGLEVWYPEHSEERTRHYLRLASAEDLIPTGGSDFHGRIERWADIGSVTAPDETVARLAAAAERL